MKAFAPADGEGRNGVYLARMGYDVTSVDVSNLAVDKAHALAAAAGVEIDARVGNMFEYEWPENHFDLIIISFMHFCLKIMTASSALSAEASSPAGS